MAKKRQIISKNSIISNFESLSKEEKIDLLALLALSLKEKPSQEFIPVVIFDNDKLSTFEALVKYLKEILKYKFVKIASLLQRSDKTIWITYKKARQKMPSRFPSVVSDIKIPISNFSNRDFTILESLVYYLKYSGYSNHEIAKMLQRDDRTIWAVINRSKRKKWIKK